MAEGNRRIGAEVFVTAEQAKTELKSVQNEVAGVGTAAQKTSNSASAAMNGVAVSTNATAAATGNLLFKHQQVGQEINRVNVAIKAESAALDLMTRVSGRSADAQGLLASKIAESEQIITGLLVQKKALTDQSGRLDKQIDRSSGAFKQLTTTMTTGQGAFQGYDAAIQGILRSVGGIPLYFSLIIGLGSQLLPVILNLVQSKKQLVEVDHELISADIAAANASQTYAERQERVKRVNDDLLGILEAYRDQSIKLNSTIEGEGKLREKLNGFTAERLALAQQEIRRVNEISTAEYNAAVNIVAGYGDTSRALQVATAARQKDQAEIRATVDALIRFAVETGKTSEQILAVARNLYGESAALKQLTADLNAGRLATEEFTAALNKLKIAKIDVGSTGAGLESQRAQINQRIAGQKAGGQSDSDIAATNQAALDAYIRNVTEATKREAAMNKERLTSEELQRRVNNQIRSAPDFVNQYGSAVQRMGDVVEKKHRSMEAAARAYANALVELQKRAEQAEAALKGDSFAAREAKVRAEIAAERQHLQINQRDKKAALDALDRTERAMLQKIQNDRVAATEDMLSRVFQLQIKNIANERARKLAEIDFEVAQERKKLTALFEDEQTVNSLINAYKEQLVIQFNQWDAEQHRKTLIEKGRATRAALQAEALAREADARARRESLVEGRQSRDDQVREFNAERIARVFGSAARDTTIFAQQLKAVELIAQGHPFQALAIEAQLLSEQMRTSQTDAQRWFDFLSNATQQMGSNIVSGFEGIVNGTKTLSQVMKQIVFDLIASLAEQWGAYYLAIGIADMFWNPAKGAAELAAGAALMALAGVLRGLGGSGGSNSASAGGGGGAAASGGSTAADRPTPQTRVIPFPTSGRTPVQVQFDATQTNQLMKQVLSENGVVTVESAQREHRPVLKKSVA